jgi:dTDP-4-amino-4,6-dideoxygalactose transaminase
MTEFQAAILLGQLEMLPELAARRARNAAILSQALASVPGIRPLPPQPALTSEAIYCYVLQFSEQACGVSRDMFVAALDAEGIPSDGRFYEPVYRSDLFRVNRRDFPQLPETYGGFDCPVSERAAYHEAVWLPQFVLLGGEDDIGDIAHAIGKVCRSLPDLAGADPALAGSKAMSRAERPRVEKGKNY